MTINRRALLRTAAATAGVTAGGLMLPTAAMAETAPPPDPFGDGSYAMLCLGDSITAGSTTDAANGIATGSPGLTTGNGYRKYLRDWLMGPNEVVSVNMIGSLYSGNAGLHHEGHPGQPINTISAAVNTSSLAPQFIVFMGGANDFGSGHPAAQVLSDTSDLLDKLIGWASWTRIVLCKQILMSGSISHVLTDNSRRQQEYNDGLPALVATKAGRVVLADTDVIAQDMLDGSGVHPLDNGYRWLAHRVYHALAPWLGWPSPSGKRYMVNIPVPPGNPRPTWMLG